MKNTGCRSINTLKHYFRTKLSLNLLRFSFIFQDLVALRKELSETYGEVLVLDTVSMIVPSEGGALIESKFTASLFFA